MAKATALTAPPVVTHVVVGYTLQLDVDEANILHDILSRIGGSPYKSRRGIAGNVLTALQDAGVEGLGGDDIETSHRTIYFEDFKD